MPITPPRCLVVVPTYDEAETIETFLDEVVAATRSLDASVLVVDDSSPNDTGDLVRAHDAYGARELGHGLTIAGGVRRSARLGLADRRAV